MNARKCGCIMEPLEPRRLLSAVMLSDINPGASASSPENLVQIGDTLYFTANDGTHGQ
jgi:hypothetical protein